MNELALAYSFTGILFLIGQLRLLYGHRIKIGTEAGDQITDRYATPLRMQLAFLALSVLGLALVIDAFRPWMADASPLLVRSDYGWRLAGALILGIGGYALRIWSVRTLGRFFTFQIGIRAGHRVIQSGPYRVLRHPSYTGYLLFTTGFCIWAGSWWIALLVLLPTFVSLMVRIIDEENMLRKNFGAEYENYSLRSWRLLPFLF